MHYGSGGPESHSGPRGSVNLWVATWRPTISRLTVSSTPGRLRGLSKIAFLRNVERGLFQHLGKHCFR